jgi:hypothetical protein
MAYDAELAERLRAVLAGEPGVSEKRMFGGLAFLLDGHLAVAASGAGGLLLRCDPARTDELVARPPATRAVMRGREMDGWLRVPAGAVRTDERLRHWVGFGTAYARSLPPARPARSGGGQPA